MTVSAVLAAADARLTPETWTQQVCADHQRGLLGKRCAHLAIDAAAPDAPTRRAALRLFAQVVDGTPALGGIWLWNDDPSTTLADVHAAFQAAQAIAQAQEQAQLEAVTV